MNKHKINLNEIKGALTRSEMRKIMAGSADATCSCPNGKSVSCSGGCSADANGTYCNNVKVCP